MRGHRAGHHEPMEETLAFLAMAGGGSSGGSVAIYKAQNATLVTVASTDPTAPTPVASIAGVAVAAGQKVVVSGSINFTGAVDGSRPALTISVDGTTVDAVTDENITSGVQEVTTRAITFSGLSVGAHTILLGAAALDGAGNLTIAGPGGGLAAAGQLTVMVA